MTRPDGYPRTANSGIYDAQAFTFSNRRVWHTPAKYPDGNKVIARCGVYGYAVERDSRLIDWYSGYGDVPQCPRCRDK